MALRLLWASLFLVIMSKGIQTSQTTIGFTTPSVTPGQIVVSNENPNLRITMSLFDGTNYLSWSKSATLILKSKGKLGMLMGLLLLSKLGISDLINGIKKTLWL